MDYYVTLAVLYALHAIRVYKSPWKLNDAQNEKQGKHAQKSAQSGDEQTGISLVVMNSTSAFLGVYTTGAADTWVLTTHHPLTTKAFKCTITFNSLNHLMKRDYPCWAEEELSFEKISTILKVT